MNRTLIACALVGLVAATARGQEPVATPTFSVPGGVYAVRQNVIVSCATPGATIHFTVDGTTPTAASPVLTNGAPVVVAWNLTLRAQAFQPGLESSAVASANYQIIGAIAAGKYHTAV